MTTAGLVAKGYGAIPGEKPGMCVTAKPGEGHRIIPFIMPGTGQRFQVKTGGHTWLGYELEGYCDPTHGKQWIFLSHTMDVNNKDIRRSVFLPDQGHIFFPKNPESLARAAKIMGSRDPTFVAAAVGNLARNSLNPNTGRSSRVPTASASELRRSIKPSASKKPNTRRRKSTRRTRRRRVTRRNY